MTRANGGAERAGREAGRRRSGARGAGLRGGADHGRERGKARSGPRWRPRSRGRAAAAHGRQCPGGRRSEGQFPQGLDAPGRWSGQDHGRGGSGDSPADAHPDDRGMPESPVSRLRAKIDEAGNAVLSRSLEWRPEGPWAAARRCMSPDAPARATDDANIRPPAMAARSSP